MGSYKNRHAISTRIQGSNFSVTTLAQLSSCVMNESWASQYGAGLWSDYIPVPRGDIHAAYPFAEPCFAVELRPLNDEDTVLVLFSVRLSPENGIYTFLETLRIDLIAENSELSFPVTTAGSDKPQGIITQKLVNATRTSELSVLVKHLETWLNSWLRTILSGCAPIANTGTRP